MKDEMRLNWSRHYFGAIRNPIFWAQLRMHSNYRDVLRLTKWKVLHSHQINSTSTYKLPLGFHFDHGDRVDSSFSPLVRCPHVTVAIHFSLENEVTQLNQKLQDLQAVQVKHDLSERENQSLKQRNYDMLEEKIDLKAKFKQEKDTMRQEKGSKTKSIRQRKPCRSSKQVSRRAAWRSREMFLTKIRPWSKRF